MVKFHWIRVLITVTVVHQQVNATGVNVSFSYPNGNVLGKTAVLHCDWAFNEGQFMLNVMSSSMNLFTCYLSTINCSRDEPHLIRHSINWTTKGSFSMTIKNLHCSDEGTYRCYVDEYKAKQLKISNSTLNLKVLPTPPMISDVQVSVTEDENITATCTAILGYPKPLDIVWKTFKNGQLVDLSAQLIVTAVSVFDAGDDNCTIRKQSTVYLKAKKDYQGLILACFVSSLDFQPSVPDFCKNATEDLCSQTEPVTVSQSGNNIAPETTKFPFSVTSIHKTTIMSTVGNDSTCRTDARERCRFRCPEPECSDLLLLVSDAVLSVVMVGLVIVTVVLMKRIKVLETTSAESKEGKPDGLGIPEIDGHTPV